MAERKRHPKTISNAQKRKIKAMRKFLDTLLKK